MSQNSGRHYPVRDKICVGREALLQGDGLDGAELVDGDRRGLALVVDFASARAGDLKLATLHGAAYRPGAYNGAVGRLGGQLVGLNLTFAHVFGA